MTKVKINDENQTGFFIKIHTNDKEKYLLTCGHQISDEKIKSKINIDLYYGKDDSEHKTIKLDSGIRYIKTFQDITLIEIIQNDGISEDKYLIPDYNYQSGYEKYKKNKIYFSGFIENYTKKNAFSGEIISINGFKFTHRSDNLRTSGSPICILNENDSLYVIGVYKAEEQNGIFIGKILDDLKKENPKSIDIINNNKSNIITQKFFSYDENKNKYSDFNKNVLRAAFNQNHGNYKDALKALNNFLNDKKDNEINAIVDIMKIFDEYNNDHDKMLKEFLGIQGFIAKINRIIRKDNNEINKNIFYFIGGFLNILESSEVKIKNEIQIFRGDKMDHNQIINYQKKKNKIIFYKGFCSATKSRDIAIPYSNILGNSEAYSVITTINYKINKDLSPNCFDISKFDKFKNEQTVLFAPNTCFKIKEVKLDKPSKKAEILVDSVGIKRDENVKEVKDIIYKESGNFFQVI